MLIYVKKKKCFSSDGQTDRHTFNSNYSSEHHNIKTLDKNALNKKVRDQIALDENALDQNNVSKKEQTSLLLKRYKLLIFANTLCFVSPKLKIIYLMKVLKYQYKWQ